MTYNTYKGWKSYGFVVKKGEKALIYDEDYNEWLFGENQVTKIANNTINQNPYRNKSIPTINTMKSIIKGLVKNELLKEDGNVLNCLAWLDDALENNEFKMEGADLIYESK